MAAAIEAVLALIFLWWLKQISVWWVLGLWLLFRLVLWGLLVRLVYYPSGLNRWRHFWSLVMSGLGALAFLLFTEWNLAWWLLGILFVACPAASFWLVPSAGAEQLAFVFKPYRRWRLFLSVFGLSGLWSGVFAFFALQIVSAGWLWLGIIAGAIVSILLSAWWWEEYGLVWSPDKSLGTDQTRVAIKKFYWWLLAIGLLTGEAAWVLASGPFGYVVNGLLLSWLWYILWLLTRFQLSENGIDWEKQRTFLLINAAVLLSFLLLIVRWK